ncbi:MAG: type II toxin-antitoxin system RelE/ParE family toxin [Marinilabiliaceae bacterium]|nr:type II toxin-antitoxin system RelE/ParE family toxin [Marinilabiliaceae bacterium]
MEKYKIKIEPDAINDIKEISNWYNKRKKDLGNHFKQTVITQISSLKHSPYRYAIRYQKIRCALVRRYPYMIHFNIDEEKKAAIIFDILDISLQLT